MSENTQEKPSSNNVRELSRREFTKLLAGLGLGFASAELVRQTFTGYDTTTIYAEGSGSGKPHWAMAIDLDTCIGCKRCVYACQAVNDTASGHLWNIMTETTSNNLGNFTTPEESLFGSHIFLTRPCMHCEHAPCVEVCPVGATYHREDGLVTMDYDKCIGCRYCMVACPYGVRVFNWQYNDQPNPQAPTYGTPEVERRPRGVVEKCTFCSHRLDAAAKEGLRPGYDRSATPACCVICPVEARVFGDINDPNSPVSQKLAGRQAVVLRANLGTKPRVYYVLPR